MKKLFLSILILTSCGDSEQLLKDGTYDVAVTYAIDYCTMCSVQGETSNQKWEVENDVVFMFDRSQEYPMTEDGNRLVFFEDHGTYTFYMELFPGRKREGFHGYWYVDYPGLMLTVTNVEGHLK